MKNKKIISLLVMFLTVVVLTGNVQIDAYATSNPKCSTLYTAVKAKSPSGAKKLSRKTTCTFLTSKYRKCVTDFYYATDSDQVYCVCIVKADSTSNARKIKSQFDATLKSQKNNTYLSTSQKKVVKAAKTGRNGSYVWYISLSSSSTTNSKAVSALKAKL